MQRPLALVRLAFDGRRLPNHHMSVRAAGAERAHTRDPRSLLGLPPDSLSRNGDRELAPGDMGVGSPEMEVAWNFLVLERQQDFDEPGDAGSGFQVADIG